MKTGVLFSGGLDSAAMIAALLRQGIEIHPIYVRCGLPWENRELTAARRFLRAIKSPLLHPLAVVRFHLDDAYRHNWSHKGRTPGARSQDRAVFLPARNLLLITKAFLYLYLKNISKLSIATLKGNPFHDATPHFFRELEEVIGSSLGKRVKIDLPFRSMTKESVLALVPDAPLHLTVSCLNPLQGRHCGRCNKCAERKKAFQRANVADRTRYAINHK